MDKTGIVRIWHDGTMHTLSRPKWGQYKRVRNAVADLAPLDHRRIELVPIVQDGTGAAQADALAEFMKLTDELAEARVPVIQFIFSEVSDTPLSEDSDNWEAWLLTDDKFLPSLLEHWQSVPLARGE